MKPTPISVIVPIRYELENLDTFFTRLHQTLTSNNIPYEAIVIDDNSDDGSYELSQKLAKEYPIKVFRKQTKVGKGYSILEGVNHAQYDLLAVIDADLAFPPESIPEMVAKAAKADIIVADRVYINGERKIKKFLNKVYRVVFGKVLFGLEFDIQAGLKVYRKSLIQQFDLHPSTWSLDLEFLYRADRAGYTIVSHLVDFGSRHKGKRKLNLFTAGVELALMALVNRVRPLKPLFLPAEADAEVQIGWNTRRFTSHNNLSFDHSAIMTFTLEQKLFIAALLTLILLALLTNWHLFLIVLVSLLCSFYFADLLFYAYLIKLAFKSKPTIDITAKQIKEYEQTHNQWPTYSVLCPLYKEWQVVPQFVEALSKIDYPKDRLEVFLVLEEDDQTTVSKVKSMQLPSFVKFLVTPDSQPKTKPKACNYALKKTKGEFVVIYDAEDIPDVMQLKKAVVAFDQTKHDRVICLQAKLNFYNVRQNLLTRLFTAEYSLWFDLILPGLNALKAPIPLGGTSNHFRKKDLTILHGWDPFNVTEDCDLGMRLFKLGYRTEVLESTTLEEANSHFGNWIKQRSRWVKGYMQTYLVHMRRPHEFVTDWSNWHLLTFQLVIGGKTLSMLINPFLWLLTILYFTMRATVGPFIESLYLDWVFYLGVTSLIFGNFLYLYYYMIGCAKRGQWNLIKYAYITPVYWLMMSVSAWIALYEIFIKPHYWQKTVHGFHLEKEKIPTPILSSSAAI